MGFPSPAADYVSQRMTPELICGVGIDTRILETSSGFALIEPVTRLVQGQTLLILIGGRTQFAKLRGKALITEDGEAIEGEALNDVTVHGVLTHTLNQVKDDKSPVM
ncbi:hypothetical protein HEN05_010040 [Escherichia coli]|uniref:hypothetical protein n=1 Tax=Escherichia coli TaxID=562 RepID=UPI000B7F75EF|nr:hypothetical protein [Escherichia coli]EFB5405117.1 hypothetical protein [Escherichia coli]EIX6816319.1 hypothetical protein [Escherichia coli]MBB2323011.1 hypothetical protein [Escherichia coli]